MKTKKIEIWEFIKRALKKDYTKVGDKMELIPPYYYYVYHDSENKVAVATEGHKLLISKKAYKEELAGKKVMKNGNEAEFRYPNYNMVIPEVQQPYYVNLDSLTNAIVKANTHGADECLVRLNKTCFDPQFAELMLRYMVQHKVDIIGINQKYPTDGAACIESQDGICLLMPMVPVVYDIPMFDVEVELKGHMDYVPTWKH